MALTRDDVRDMREKLRLASQVEGFEVEVGNASFNATEVTFKVTMRQTGAEKTTERDFQTYAFMFGLQPSWFGQTFLAGGHAYTITGLNRKAKSMPVLASRGDGKVFKFSAETVKLHLTK